MWFTSNNKTRSLVTAAQWELTEWCKSQRWFCSFNTVQWKKDVPIKGNNASALLCPGKLLLKCCFQLGTTHLPFTGLLLERTKTLTQWASSMARPGWELGISSCCHCLVPKSCPILCNPMDCSPPGSSVYGISQGKNTGVSCHCLLQGIFPTQRSNPDLPYWQAGSLPLSHQGWYQHILQGSSIQPSTIDNGTC